MGETLAETLIELQARLPRITKDDEAQVGTRTYAYANLATINEVALPVLCELGLLWKCHPTMLDSGAFVLAWQIMHVPSGETDQGTYPLPSSGSPQQIGSAITYGRRYAFKAVLNIAPREDDDDGQAAEQHHRAKPDPAQSMTPAQKAAHTRLANMDKPPRPADRSRGDGGFDASADPDEAGSITDAQRARLHAAFGRAGRDWTRDDKLAYAMSALDLPELASSNDLSMRQAGTLIAKLEAEAQS